jgi:hypothetical protein
VQQHHHVRGRRATTKIITSTRTGGNSELAGTASYLHSDDCNKDCDPASSTPSRSPAANGIGEASGDAPEPASSTPPNSPTCVRGTVCGGFGTYTFRLGVVVALVVGAFGEEGMASRGRWGE